MDESILNSIKQFNGVSPEDTSFDSEIIIHTNSTFMILKQLGVGPSTGFSIQDKTKTWTEYVSDEEIREAIKSFMYLKVKLVFDPPASPTILEALTSAAKEYEWRIVELVEEKNAV